MAGNQIPFTKEQKEILALNPFTLSVNDYQIRFTVEFKKYLLAERGRNHTPWKDIFRKAGYDPEIIGIKRMEAIIHRVRKEALSEKGLHETRKKSRNLTESTDRQQLRNSVRELQQEVEHLKQQIEFLKKTQMLQTLEENEEKPSTD